MLPEVARYRLHYTDGRSIDVPVILEKHIDHWLQDGPKRLESAVCAWSVPLEGEPVQHAVLYGMKVSNPRPDAVIATVDMLPGMDSNGKPANRAVPVLLAITAGTVVK